MGAKVSCGNNQDADSCAKCPKSKDPTQVWKWCSGDCVWSEENKACGDKSSEKYAANHEGYMPAKPSQGAINCGKVKADSCEACPVGDKNKVWTWCSGDCVWNERDKVCMKRKAANLDATGHDYLDSKAAYADEL